MRARRRPPNPITLAQARETRGALAEWHNRKSQLCRAARYSYCGRVDGAAFCYNCTAYRRRACHPESTHVAVYEVGALLVSDGNAVIKADATYYQLHSSRLARYCVYFKKLFSDDVDDYEDRCGKVDGCPVYHIPADLNSGDFENLLAVLETPLIYTDAPPTQNVVLSPVRAAHGLSCGVVLKLARRRLCAIWDAEHPSKASSGPATLDTPTKMGPAPSSLSADTTAVHTYHDAVFIILFARQYGIPALLKRAFYEFLVSAEFWAALTADRKHIRLTEDDLLRLYNARLVLQQRWREAVVLAPYMDAQGASTCRGDGSACSIYDHCYSSKSQHWRKMVLESEVVEAGMGGPPRYDAASGLTKEQKQTSCRGRRKGGTDMLALAGKRGSGGRASASSCSSELEWVFTTNAVYAVFDMIYEMDGMYITASTNAIENVHSSMCAELGCPVNLNGQRCGKDAPGPRVS